MQSDAFYDVVGSVTTVLTVLASLRHLDHSQACHLGAERWPDSCTVARLAMVLVTMWTLRLGAFLGYRIYRMGHDSRMDKIKTSPAAFFVAWTAQGVWVYCITLPMTVLTAEIAASNRTSARSAVSALGLLVWILGLMIEVVADWQKLHFRLLPENKVPLFQLHGYRRCTMDTRLPAV